jgi:hypothetical protein
MRLEDLPRARVRFSAGDEQRDCLRPSDESVAASGESLLRPSEPETRLDQTDLRGQAGTFPARGEELLLSLGVMATGERPPPGRDALGKRTGEFLARVKGELIGTARGGFTGACPRARATDPQNGGSEEED